MKISTKFLFVILFLFYSAAGFSQDKDTTAFKSTEEYTSNPFKRFGRDIFIQAVSPFHISKDNAYWVGAGVLTTAVLIASDQGSYNTLKEMTENTRFTNKASHIITQLGGTYGIGFLGLFSGFSFIINDDKAKETSYLAVESFLTSGLWGIVIKSLTGRERPSSKNLDSDGPGGRWSGPLAYFGRHKGKSISSFDAFPSGHTATAFSIATVFANQYNKNLIVPFISYGLASLVGISRIIEDTHWASDVFVGAVLGYLTSIEILKNNPSELSRKEKTGFRENTFSKIKKHLSLGINPFDKSLSLSYLY